jgi:hypothetical protein
MLDSVAEEFADLEQRLMSPEVRKNPQALNALLAEDFFEFGSSGTVYNRNEVLAALSTEQSVERVMSDLTVKRLSDDTVLLTYRLMRYDGRSTLRVSIWQFQAGQWKMIFHQGTPAA